MKMKRRPNKRKDSLIHRHFIHFAFYSFILLITCLNPSNKVASAAFDLKSVMVSSNLTSGEVDKKEYPLRIMIPSANVNVGVTNSTIDENTKTWVVPEHTAAFAVGSSFLDESHGNSLIFAHARNGLFGRLEDLQNGEMIFVLGSDKMYSYRVESTEQILPDEMDKILSNGDFNLTLFTCDGPNDVYRFVVKAKRINETDLSRPSVV